jgi:hypothetical protein
MGSAPNAASGSNGAEATVSRWRASQICKQFTTRANGSDEERDMLMSMVANWRLYRTYRKWCHFQGGTPLPYREFNRELGGVFMKFASSASPTPSEAEFEVALCKTVGDCKPWAWWPDALRRK